jgi:ornithine cyclodeaminase/alanine dehydrogenase-like protein (mu-crystallin family)
MIRYLTEKDVHGLLDMPTAIGLVERALADRALGRAVDVPRVRARIPAGTLHVLEAAAPELDLIGYKAYYSAVATGTRFFVHLFEATSGKPVAMIEASHLGMVRTGAASGAAARYLARKDAAVVGMIGAGKQAVGQLEAVCNVRKIEEIRVWSRSRDRAQKFCDDMLPKLNVPMRAVDSAEHAVRGVDIINVITKSATPVLKGEWLEPGQHVNAAGSNALTRREIDEAAARRADLIVVDARGTAKNECGDLLPLVEKGFLDWDALTELGDIIAGRAPGRTKPEQITLYESHGMGIQDIYVAGKLLEMARARNVGVDLPIG